MGWKKAKDITNTPAVFKLPLAKENLQWAGGSVIRLYTEYLWENQMYDKNLFSVFRWFCKDSIKSGEKDSASAKMRPAQFGSMVVN